MSNALCDTCGELRQRTRFQEKAKRDSDLCESCFIRDCSHTHGNVIAPQSGIVCCARCGVQKSGESA